MKYRAEIDGLRAIAVIPVILFHGGFEQFSGGFVGVDVFFVISGYLITTIILSEKEQGTFSLIGFYDRRARRILPALFLVILASLPFAWLWLLPSDMKDFSQSLVAVSTFSSNILFWSETGYWGVENELKPMLHTWSLAVEEQYYVIFPLFLMLMWRFRKRWIFSSFIVMSVLSLILSEWASHNMPTANFFLLPTRGWELAIGASIAFYFLYRKEMVRVLVSNRAISETLSLIGFSLIVYAVFLFDENVPFPGLFSLVPTLGAGLIIIFSSSETVVGKLLASRILVGIGLVSYSAYLWHQPLFAFARHRSLEEPSGVLFIVLALLTFLFAYLSWRYVEKPFRTRGLLSKKIILVFGIICSSVFITIGLLGHFTDGFSGWLYRNQITKSVIKEKWNANRGFDKACSNGSFTLSPECRTSDEPEILVWGDSVAMHLVKGIVASSPAPKVIQMTRNMCGPFFDVAPVTLSHPVGLAESCLEFNKDVREWMKSNTTVKYVVISSLFSQYFNGQLLTREGELIEANFDAATIAFGDTLAELRSMGFVPVVFSPPPKNGRNLGRCLAKAEWLRLSLDACDFDLSEILQGNKSAFHLLENISEDYHVIRLDEMICTDSTCEAHIGSTWVYRDQTHLSNEGSIVLGKEHDFYSIIVNDAK